MWYFTILLGCCFLGCQDSHEVIFEFEQLGDPFEVPAQDYSTNYFFVDTSYISQYEPYFLDNPPDNAWSRKIVELEVWVNRIGPYPDPNEFIGKASVHLREFGGGYPDALHATEPSEPGNIERLPFTLLRHTEYDLIEDGMLGIIRINHPLVDLNAIAVAYRCADGTQFGEFVRNLRLDSAFFASGTPILLKLVRPPRLLSEGPRFRDPWRQLVKSIYPTGYQGVIRTQFRLDAYLQNSNAPGSNAVLGQPLLAILGLDRYLASGMPAPHGDGVFDYRPGRTIHQNYGNIILPYVRPFDDGFRRHFASIGQPIPANSDLVVPQLYDSTSTALSRHPMPPYVFRGRALHQ
jgi:hypothetical protein